MRASARELLTALDAIASNDKREVAAEFLRRHGRPQ